MQKQTKFLFVVLFLFSIFQLLPSSIEAAVPHLINYQGRLTDTSGKPVADGSYSITFRLYDTETAGNLLWEETNTSVVVAKGIFSVLLGSVTSLDLPFEKQYYLEIKVGSEVMSPRQRISSAGYAMRAEKADTAIQANNADTIGNVGVSTTPAANKILPLDSNAKLPLSALKVYDSGWFAITSNTAYTKPHNLGTTKVIISLFGATDGSGNNMNLLGDVREYGLAFYGVTVSNIRTNSVDVRVGQYDLGNGATPRIWNGSAWVVASYIRIVMLAFE